tara:strand:- start:476 stop:1192 length:717 start_codon:yes stop_codon:yes gene_type:complete
MQYLGGKSRISDQIVSLMSAEREEGMTWVEPFMGSGKVISKVTGKRIGADVNHEMIALFKAIREGWKPPTSVTKEFFLEVKNNPDQYPDYLRAFIGIGCSYGGIRWGSYAQNNTGTNYAQQAYNSLMKLKPLLEGIDLVSSDYQSLAIPERSLIYCDPPYANTQGYGFNFNHEEFYLWCQNQVKKGHFLFVSEYDMPKPFVEIWSKTVPVTLGRHKVNYKKERLFRLHQKPPFSLKMY